MSIQVVITCRTKDYHEIAAKLSLGGASVLQSLNDDQIRDYLHDLPDLWAILEGDDELKEVARTPLLLSLFAFAFQDLPDEAKALHDLSPHEIRNKIFETYINQQYEREKRKPHSNIGFTLDQLIEQLSTLAAYMYMQTWRMYVTTPASFLSEYELQYMGANVELLELGQKLQILIKDNQGKIGFISNLIRDMFVWDRLILYLKDDKIEHRLGSARGLGFVKEWEAAAPLLELLKTETDPFVRYAARASLDAINLEHTIFVSYRRRDWPIVFLLTQELEKRLGANVFFDRDIDEPDFAKSLMRNLNNSRVFVLIVTEKTFTPTRIHSEDDWIQKEIKEALNKMPIVLVQVDTTLPDKKLLPKAIRRVLDKQAIVLNQHSFYQDVEKLVDFICTVSPISRNHTKHTNKISVFGDKE